MQLIKVDTENKQIVFRTPCGEIMDVFYHTFKLREGFAELYIGKFISCALFGDNFLAFKNKVHS